MLFYLRYCPKFTTFLPNGFPFARILSKRYHNFLTISAHCCRICVYLHKFFPREEKIFPSGGKKYGLGFRHCIKWCNFAPS